MAEYIYGIVDAAAAPPARPGIGQARVRVVSGDGAAALVSDLEPQEVRLGPKEVLTHSEVLSDALAHGSTVLPMRFGVVMEGSDAVRTSLLEPHADELRSQLDRFEGEVELNVRVIYDEQALLRDVVTKRRDIAGLRESIQGKPEAATYYERIELGHLVADAVEVQRERDAIELLDQLAPIATAVEVGDPVHERMVLGASFLVSRKRLDEFDSTLERLARERSDRMRFKLTGPLPPHSFVELTGGE